MAGLLSRRMYRTTLAVLVMTSLLLTTLLWQPVDADCNLLKCTRRGCKSRRFCEDCCSSKYRIQARTLVEFVWHRHDVVTCLHSAAVCGFIATTFFACFQRLCRTPIQLLRWWLGASRLADSVRCRWNDKYFFGGADCDLKSKCRFSKIHAWISNIHMWIICKTSPENSQVTALWKQNLTVD